MENSPASRMMHGVAHSQRQTTTNLDNLSAFKMTASADFTYRLFLRIPLASNYIFLFSYCGLMCSSVMHVLQH